MHVEKLNEMETGFIPLHLAQQEVYFDQMMNVDSPCYNVGGYLRLKGTLDIGSFREVLQAMVDAFDIFRLSFDLTGDQPGCRLSEGSVDCRLVELDFTLEEAPDQQALQWMQGRFNMPFDLHGPLYEQALIKVAPDEHWWYSRNHHLILDGFSFSIVAKYVADRYASLSREDVKSAGTCSGYWEDIIGSGSYLASKDYSQDEAYWQARFDAIPDCFLKIKYERPGISGMRSDSVHFAIGEELRRSLEEARILAGVDLQQLLIGALALYFYKVEGWQEFICGLSMHNRTSRRQRNTPGMFAGVVPFQCVIEPDQTLMEFLHTVKSIQRQDYRHLKYPISHLNRHLQLLSSRRTQLFDVAFNYSAFDFNVKFGDLHVTAFEMSSEFERLPLHFYWRDFGPQQPLQVKLNYQQAYFDREDIERIWSRFLVILQQFSDGLNKNVSAIGAITEKERSKLLYEFNNTVRKYPTATTVVDLIREQAVRTPDSVAVEFGDQLLTYRELDRESNRMARYLQRKGVTPGALVPLCLNRGMEMIVSVLGILKTGAAYVPIDPAYPIERVRFLLEDTMPLVIVTNTQEKGALPQGESYILIEVDNCRQAIEQEGGDDLPVTILSDWRAYVIYTSGSTGRPKGVMIDHKALLNRLLWAQDHFQLTPEDAVLQKTTFCFDVSVWELLWPVFTGAKLVLARPGGQTDNDYLKAVIERHGITLLHFVPSALQVFLADLPVGGCSGIRKVICSGEELKYPQVQLFRSRLPRAELHNLYGPTEAAIDVTSWTLLPGDAVPDIIPIGKPVANTRLYILNRDKSLSPPGGAGELYIGGVQVAIGYLKREELTAQRFIPDPFCSTEGDRLYRTGDLARWMDDGNVRYLGRIDDQVKIRGYRIEPGEIELVMEQNKRVERAVVLAQDTSSGEKELVAYIVPAAGFDGAELKAYLKDSLPVYMIPARFVEIQRLPLTINGKIDKRALIEKRADQVSADQTSPQTPMEVLMAELWQRLLNKDRVGIHANFFELGGHSLIATRLISHIRKIWQTGIVVKDIFEHPTVNSLSALLETRGGASPLPPLTAAPRTAYLPLSYAQESIWFLHKLAGSFAYHMPAVCRLKGPLNIVALERAFRLFVDRQEVLRTVITEKEGIPVQGLLPEQAWRLELLDKPEPENLQALIRQKITLPFDLSAGHMLRAWLAPLGKEEHLLIVTIHHIAFDGWSVNIMIRELKELYEAYIENRPTHLPARQVTYGDYAVWQRNYLQGSIGQQQLSFWTQKLSGLAPLDIPTDHLRPPVRGKEGAVVEFSLDGELTAQIRSLARQRQSTLYMVLLAAFKVVLWKYSGQCDIAVGSPVSVRPLQELENIAGPFINTIVIRSVLSPAVSFAGLLDSIRENTMQAFENQDLPFEKLVEVSGKQRTRERDPLFQVMFALQEGDIVSPFRMGALAVLPEPVPRESAKFEITLTMIERTNGLTGQIEYATDLFRKETIERMAGHFETVLRSVTRQPGSALSALTMMNEQERHHILTSFNDTRREYAAGHTILDLLARQIAKTPDHAALVSDAIVVTYRQLDERSNKLAHYLRRCGIREGDKVALCIGRGPDMVAGMLAIWRSGAAYVPVDPAYPADRIAYLLDNSNAPFLVSSSVDKQHLGETRVRIIEIDTEWPEIDQQPADPVGIKISPDQLSHIIYTSGSTGRPKGVMITHRNTFSFISWCLEEFQNDDFELVYAVTSLCFDLSVFELFYPLCAGKMIRVIKDVLTIGKYLANDKAVLLNCVPSVIRMLLDTESPLHGVSAINMAGEPVPPYLVHAPAIRHARLRNLYGPTEDTTYSTMYRLQPEMPVLIGKPIANKRVYILDETGALCPIGIPGEICIGGDGVARGYLNLPELTAEKFIPDLFSGREGARLYKTGDAGRWLPDGNIAFIGRMDDQVKIRGYRIEPREIEQVILETGHARQVLVMGRPDAAGDVRLIAYVIPETDFTPTGLVALLKLKLPGYMVPSCILELAEWPVTLNGKIDKNALPVPDGASGNEQVYAAPSNELEEKLVEVWQDVLGPGPIGIQDNFFQLGGHSLMAVKLNAQIEKRLGIPMDVGKIFAYPTIAELGRFITGRKGREYRPITLLPQQEHYACSHAQKRLWILGRIRGGSMAYNVPVVIAFRGQLRVSRLQEIFKVIFSRHENLRTGFIEIDGEPRQIILAPDQCVLAIPEYDLTGVADPVSKVEEWVTREAGHAFDLSTPPLLHMAFFHTGKEESYLALNIHHIICDDWAREVMLGEFIQAYKQYAQAPDMGLPPLAVQYKDYAAWHNEVCLGYGEYWRSLPKGYFPALHFPPDHERPKDLSFAGDTVRRSIPASLLERLTNMARSRNMTLNNVLLALYGLHTAHYSGQEEVVVGSVVSGRGHPDTESLTGVFMNFLPLKLSPLCTLTLNEYLRSSNESIVEAYSNQDYPFDLIVEACAGKRDPARNPLFDTMVNFHWKNPLLTGVVINEPGQGAGELQVNMHPIKGGGNQALLDFKLDIETLDAGLDLYLSYNTGLFERQRMEGFLFQFTILLEKVIASQDGFLAGYTGFTGGETSAAPAALSIQVPVKVVLCASFVIDPAKEYLEYWSREMDLGLDVTIGPYNQLFQELLHAEGLLCKNTGINVLVIRLSDWLREQPGLDPDGQKRFLDDTYRDLCCALEQFRQFAPADCLIGLVPPEEDLLPSDVRERIRCLNRDLESYIRQTPSFSLVDLPAIAALYAVDPMFDPITDKSAHMPFSEEYYAALGTFIARKIFSMRARPYKVIAIDCDNTIWKGICGEDGYSGVEIDGGYLALQEFLLQKYQEGFLLALCSKNNEEDVWEVFEKHPGMRLRRHHLTAWRINWRPKPDNLLEMAGELQLDAGSFIFIDDNSFETAQMAACCPQVLSLTLPEDTDDLSRFLNHIWAFDRHHLTSEDINRNTMYQAERLRQREEVKFTSHDDFIHSLHVTTAIEPLQEKDLDRAVQLMERTNQFNLNGRKLSGKEMRVRLEREDVVNWVIRVSDRFGDYGFTGLLLATSSSEVLRIESFMLSCRVLGKKVEDAVGTAVQNYCTARGIGVVQALFCPTGRNKPFAVFLAGTGWLTGPVEPGAPTAGIVGLNLTEKDEQ